MRQLTADIGTIVAPEDEQEALLAELEQEVAPLNILRSELAAACQANLDILAGTAMPDTCTLLFPAAFHAIWQLLTSAVMQDAGYGRFAIGIPRGFTKTTLLKLLVLYIILFTGRNFVLVVCRTARLAENFLADISDILSDPNIKATFGDWAIGIEQDTQGQKKFSFRGRNVVLAAIGADGSVRGINVKNRRPDIILMDDMQSWENAESQQLADDLLTWMMGTLMKAASKFRCCYIFVGNMYPFPGSILRKLKQNPAWTSFIAGGLLADGESIWPELQSKEQLLEEYQNDLAMGKPEIFLAEVLNDETASGKSGVDVGLITAAPAELFNELMQGSFIIIDPANDKKNSDMTEIGYFEVRDNQPCLVALKSGRWSPGDMIREALTLAMEHGCKLVAVESVAYQYSLLYWFEQVTLQHGIMGIEFVELYPTMSKNARIREMLGQLLKGELKIHESVRSRVIYQISQWNPLKKDNVDDLLDILAYAHQILKNFAHIMTADIFHSLNDVASEGTLELSDNSLF